MKSFAPFHAIESTRNIVYKYFFDQPYTHLNKFLRILFYFVLGP